MKSTIVRGQEKSLTRHNWEMAERLGWEEWSEYDDIPETP